MTLAVVFAIGLGGIGYGVNDALHGVGEREQVQLERCGAGNDLREVLQEEKKEELAEVKSHGVPYYEQFLKGSPEQLRQIREESIQLIEDRIGRFAPENCEEAVH